MNIHLLIIEDDDSLSQMLALHFEDQGFEVSRALDCASGIKILEKSAADLIFLDQHLPDGKGIELLPKLVEIDPDLPVIMMTGMHDLDLAIQAIKQGAHDFIHKPIKIDELDHVVKRALEGRRLSRELAVLKAEPQHPKTTGDFIGRCEAMLKVGKEIALTAESHTNVLIAGESGTGKEVVARLIHNHSHLPGPFVAVNCAAIVDTLLESELFGHEKGAFTGATGRKLGKFELAQDGTLFLDEIGELALPLQAKLLRVLQDGTFERVGGNQKITSNARIIAATNRNLDDEVAEKRFREDLLYRVNVITIRLPSLRERKADIPLLTEALMHKISQKIHKPILHIPEITLQKLHSYNWPGNVRELENILTQAMVHARGDHLTPDLIHVNTNSINATDSNVTPPDTHYLRTIDEVEAEQIQWVLHHVEGHKGNACKILDISRPALDRKIIKYDLTVPGK